ncbi:hypothetical protein [Noviherbaspirillum suwonense]|uniref:Quorum-sensing-regulated virulence factor n=1 Tax=Noviherbaspirillum suwonense TaxID=1224511 RepID=A0ABY1QKY9_9BURK|nr:hypothetical protein [Noviherbaspirillum suwonense]SMP74378.1 Putative quorum-sensing-regulated virulence factor [Noviherbaspirillum suwonense]
MKKRTLALVLVCISTLAQAGPFSNLMGSYAGGVSEGDGSRNLDQTLANVSAYLNRSAPVKLDDDTRLDRVTSGPGHRLSYHYTLTSVQSKAFKRAEFQKLIRAPLQAKLCSSKEMRGFLVRGVTISYDYLGNDGARLGAARFTASDCGLQEIS